MHHSMKKRYPFTILFTLLLFHAYSQQQLENPGFENWENAGTVRDEPVDWSSIKTSDNDNTNQHSPVVWDISTDAHSGSYSVKLTNILIFGVVATGTLTNGRVHADFNPDSGYVYTRHDDPRWNTVFTDKPDSLVGWFKYYPVNNDHGGIRAILHKNDGALPEHGTQQNWIADANYHMPAETVDTWTRFSVAFDYLSDEIPEYILVVIKAGNGTDAVAGSYAFIDDLQLIYKNSGVEDHPEQSEFDFFIAGRELFISASTPNLLSDATFRLLDTRGQVVFKTNDLSTVITLTPTLKTGVYIGSILYENRIISKKLFLE